MRSLVFTLAILVVCVPFARGQDSSSPWMVMSDGALFAEFNHQGTDAGGAN